MNRKTLRGLTHAHRKPGDLNRTSTHKMRSKMGMGSKVHIREAIAKKLGKGESDATVNKTTSAEVSQG